jgi:Ca-activated chloride channel homolog
MTTTRTIWFRWLPAAALAVLLVQGTSLGQEARAPELGRATHVVVPQSRGFSLSSRRPGIQIDGVDAHVKIIDRTATTTLEVAVRNPTGSVAEAVVLLPVPEGGAVSGFTFEGGAAEPTATLLRREEARRTYDDIVRRARDPALLEFAGYNLIRSSVFPVPAGGTQRVRLRYEQVLGGTAGRVDYVLPRTESMDARTPWTITVGIRSETSISTVFSPSHELSPKRASDKHFSVRLEGDAAREPGPLHISYLTETKGVSASLFAYPDASIGGGYFLFFAGLPARAAEDKKAVRREVTVVIDRSGSMAGEKMDQVRTAARQVIEGLADGEAFNVIDYSTTVAMLAPKPLVKNRENTLKARAYLDSLRPTGGTNIHDALVEALRQEPTDGALPLVLFLTDGLPTVGRTAEVRIREAVEKGNPHGRRVFTLGVGDSVNVPLLDRVAELTRGRPTYVLAGEDVEVKVADVFERLYGPVLADATLETLDGSGAITTTAVRELIPATLPDLFDGDQLVLLGQYRGEDPLRLRVKGNYLGEQKAFDFTFPVTTATTRNAFVPRLWASRRIGYLVDAIRQDGADTPGVPRGRANDVLLDPRHRELVDEIVRLSTEFGVLSEYTAFLATEGTDLSNWADLVAGCGIQLDRKAVRTRSGRGAVNQGLNNDYAKNQESANRRNFYLDENLQRVGVTGVLQVSDRAFFRRGNRWIDSRLIASKSSLEPDRVVVFGSPEHRAIVTALIARNRQAVLSLRGGIVIDLGGERVLIRDPDDC